MATTATNKQKQVIFEDIPSGVSSFLCHLLSLLHNRAYEKMAALSYCIAYLPVCRP
jgi:hypothetical protein